MLIRQLFFFILLCATFITPAQALEGITGASQIPAENFFKDNTEFSYIISPDGKQLAFIRKHPQSYSIVITDLDKRQEIYDFPISQQMPRQLAWISNTRLVFGLKGMIFSVNHDGADLRILINNIYDIEKVKSFASYVDNLRYWSLLKRPSGTEEDILFLSYDTNGYANIHKVNIYTGEKKDLYDAKKLKANALYTDKDGKVVLIQKIKKDKNLFYRLLDDKSDMELADIDIASNTYKLSYDAKSFLNRTVVLHEIGYENNTMYISEKTSGDKYQLVKYNYLTNQKEILGSDPMYDIGGPDTDVSLHYDHKKRELIGFSYSADKQKTVWLDTRMKNHQTKIDRLYPGKINEIYDWNEDINKLLVLSQDAKTQGKIIVFDTETNKAIVQTDYASRLSPSHMKDTEIYRYNTQDNTSITAYLTPPASNTTQRWPLIVMPHGGPFIRSHYGYDGHAQYFSTRGYAVLEPNFRGSPGYGAKHLIAGKHQIADLMLSDIADGVKALINEGKIDPNQVYILGFSYGGYAAIMSAIKYPEIYKAAVSASAPLDLIQQLKDYKKEKSWFAYEFWNELIGAREKGKEYIKSISPYYRIEDIKIPLLIFHGDDDPIISKKQAEEFKELAEKKKLDIPVKIVQDEGHGWNLVSSNTYFVEKSLELFKKHAPAAN